MPICYEIDIDIVREDEDGTSTPGILHRRDQSENPLTPEQVRDRVNDFWNDFMAIMGEYAGNRPYQYLRGEGFRVVSVYQC